VNFPFAWCPLDPIRPSNVVGRVLGIMADRCAIIFFLLGVALTALGVLDGEWQMLPLALSVLLFGLPHGAVDHLVALGLAKRALQPVPLAVVLTLYTTIAAGVCIFWIAYPLLAAIGFLALTVYHWGKADLAFEQFRNPKSSLAGKGISRFTHGLLRGLLPIGLPLVAHPESASAFMNACMNWFQADADFDYALVRVPLLVFICTLWLLDTIRIFQTITPVNQRDSHWLIFENIGLAIFFVIVPPLAAVGLYFSGWHGYRHVLRLRACRECGQEGSRGAQITKNGRFARQALPFTLVALAAVPGLAWFLTAQAADPKSWVALYLVLISALTLPHVCVVEWMDRRQCSPPSLKSASVKHQNKS